MKRKLKLTINKLILILVFFSILFQFHIISLNKGPFSGFMWDEYEYLFIAKNLKDGFGYTSNRPPVFPTLLAIFYQIIGENFKIIKYISPFIFLTNILSLYHFTSILYNKKIGILTIFLFSSLPFPYFLSTRLLTENLFLSFFILSLATFFIALEKNIKYFLLTGIFTAFSILIRYTGITLFFIYILYILITKNFKIFYKCHFYISLSLFFLILLPWLLINIENYKNPIASLIFNFKANKVISVEIIKIPILNFKINFNPPIYYFFALPLVGSVFSITTFFYFLFYRKTSKAEILLILIFFVIFSSQLFFLGRSSIRFLNELSIIFTIFSALFFVKKFGLKTKKFFVVIFLAWFINLFLAVEATKIYGSTQHNLERTDLKLYITVKEYIKQNLPENSKILTNIIPVVADAGRNTINIVLNEESFERQLQYADYVVLLNQSNQKEIEFIYKKEKLELIQTIDNRILIYKIAN